MNLYDGRVCLLILTHSEFHRGRRWFSHSGWRILGWEYSNLKTATFFQLFWNEPQNFTDSFSRLKMSFSFQWAQNQNYISNNKNVIPGFVKHCILNLYESQKMLLPHYFKSMSIWPKIFGGLFLVPNWSQSTKLGQNRAGSGPATVKFDLESPHCILNPFLTFSTSISGQS